MSNFAKSIIDACMREPDVQELLARRVQLHMGDYRTQVRSQARKYVDVEDTMQQIRYSRKRTPYWFVTVNPKPGVTLELLHNTIVQMLSHDSITDPKWVYEIREAPSQGLHAHIMFTCHTNDVNFAHRKVKSKFVPEICGNTKAVHIRWVEEEEYSATLNYLLKADVAKSKRKAHEATIAWRGRNGVPLSLGEDHLLVWSELPAAPLPIADIVETTELPEETEPLVDNIIQPPVGDKI